MNINWGLTWTLCPDFYFIFLCTRRTQLLKECGGCCCPSANSKLELNRDKKLASDFAKICLRLALFLISHIASFSNCSSSIVRFVLPKVLCKVKSYKISLLHTSIGRGMRFYVSLMGLKCSDTSLSWVRVPRKVLTISSAHHHSHNVQSEPQKLQLGGGEVGTKHCHNGGHSAQHPACAVAGGNFSLVIIIVEYFVRRPGPPWHRGTRTTLNQK